ncbi:tRNA-binding protein [Lewinella marina]|uniref:tRNA-binding protein n=1 Tax=Neolewinella marina TaxID=438751 RepID=A0A2G0CFA9_9BACT|nr:tRNA-binding protein [Neolewinella marina]NJB85657.1 tRNA-binding protein [Neolewinella marina]PHK98661.1 tRNA-binding protein [Neolewinella marina]
MEKDLTWPAFARVDMRVGTVTAAEPFPEARQPAIKLWIDFGELGTLKSSAQITDHYTPSLLVGRQVVAVVNFPPKQIANFMSECLVLGGIEGEGAVTLLRPDRPIQNGSRIS